MNKLQQLIYNDGERLVPYVTHGEGELVRHRSSYAFFHAVISSDLKNDNLSQRGFTVADLGFGSGYGCALLSSLPGSRITGIDIGKECETFARQYYPRSNVDYLIEDLAKFVPASPEYDYVVSRGVLEHVPNGLDLIKQIRFHRRILIDVPYDEMPGNEHHIITGIKEDTFSSFGNCELFYEDIEGRIFTADNKPPKPNMIMAVISSPGLPKAGDLFKFPIEPVRDSKLEELSGMSAQGRRHYFDTPAKLLAAIETSIKETDVVLDIGCGIRPMNYFRPKLHLMVEPWHEYADILSYRHTGDKSVIVLRTGALQMLQTLSDNSVDSIFLLDVIEHLEKEIGQQVVRECERVAREQIVIFTPLGFMPQHVETNSHDGWGLGGNTVQQHLSGWEPEDFDAQWSFYICQNFHNHDFKGESLPEPYGAFFAVRNFERKPLVSPSVLSDFRQPLPSELELSRTSQALARKTTELERTQASLAHLQRNYQAVLNSRSMRLIARIRRILAALGIVKSAK